MIDSTFSVYQTDVKQWKMVPLGYTCVEVKKRNSLLLEENLLSLSYGKIIRKDIGTNEGLLPESFDGYNIVEPGDIVLRLTDLQNDKKSLRTGLVEERGIITSAYTTIRPIGVDAQWLAYTLHSYDIQKIFYALGSGLRQSMKFDDLKSLAIAVPPLEEQRRISEYLADKCKAIDNGIALHKEIAKNIKELTKSERDFEIRGNSLESVEVGGWLGSINSNWSLIRLGQLVSFKSGAGFPDSYQGKAEGDYPFIKVGDMVGSDEFGYISHANNYINAPEAKLLNARVAPRGTLIFPKVGAALLGNTRAIIDVPAVFDNNVMGLKFNDGEIRFWYHVMRAIDMARICNPGPVPSIGAESVSNIMVPFPNPAIQKEIAERLDTLDVSHSRLLEANQSAIERLSEYKTSLITAAVTGTFDVTTGRSVS